MLCGADHVSPNRMLHLGLVSSFWRMNIRDGYWSICLFYPHLSLYRDTFSISILYGFQRANEILYGLKSGDLVGSSGDLSGKWVFQAHVIFTRVPWVLWMTAGELVEILGMVGGKSIPLDTPAIVKVVYLFSLFSMVQPNIKISCIQLIMQSSLKTLQVWTDLPLNKLVSHFHLFFHLLCPPHKHGQMCTEHTSHAHHPCFFVCLFFALNQENSSKTLFVKYNCSESVQNQHDPSESPRILCFPSRLQKEVESTQSSIRWIPMSSTK